MLQQHFDINNKNSHIFIRNQNIRCTFMSHAISHSILSQWRNIYLFNVPRIGEVRDDRC